jgi:hypothetical protein
VVSGVVRTIAGACCGDLVVMPAPGVGSSGHRLEWGF